jgi:hypothetical protein
VQKRQSIICVASGRTSLLITNLLTYISKTDNETDQKDNQPTDRSTERIERILSLPFVLRFIWT